MMVISTSKKYLQAQNNIAFIEDDKEFTNTEQLSYIFPQDSHKLHKYPIESEEYKMIPHLSFNRYLWECHIDFI